jgi:hypothetical protein
MKNDRIKNDCTKSDRMKNDGIKSDRIKSDNITTDRIKSITDPFFASYVLSALLRSAMFSQLCLGQLYPDNCV